MQIDTTYWICLNGAWPQCNDSVAGHDDTLYFKCLYFDEDWPHACLDSARVTGDDDWDMVYPPEWDYFVVDTTYPTVGQIDTVGTLIGGWEQVLTRSFTEHEVEVKITARADASPADGHTTPGIPAGQVGGALFRLLGDIYCIPDTAVERLVRIKVLSTPAENFVFSRPNGTQIGLAYKQILDTNLFRCEQYDPIFPDTCLKWGKVDYPPYDSILIIPDSARFIDTMYVDSTGLHGSVWIEHGSIVVELGDDSSNCCTLYGMGNIDCSEDGKVTLSDLACLISRLYIYPGQECCCIEAANANCSQGGKLTLSDITTLIDHVFISKAPLADCCPR